VPQSAFFFLFVNVVNVNVNVDCVMCRTAPGSDEVCETGGRGGEACKTAEAC
jgi:hypothetical protein